MLSELPPQQSCRIIKGMKIQRHTAILAAILFTGLILRILAAHSYWEWHDSTFPGSWQISKLVLSHDGQTYIYQARPDTWRSFDLFFQQWENRPYYRPPLASYYFKYLFQVSYFNRLIVSTIQSFLAILAYLFLYMMAVLLFNHRVAIVSLLFLILHPVLIFYDTSFEDSPLALFLLSTTLYVFICSYNWKQPQWILSGFLMGLTVLTRPNLMIVFICLVGFCWFIKKQGRVIRMLQFAIPVLILISLPTWHNYRISGRVSFVTDTSGENLFWGNNAHPYYRTTIQGFWGIKAVTLGSSARLLFNMVREEFDEKSSERALLAAAWKYIYENPIQSTCGLIRKAFRHVANYEIPRNRNFFWLRESSPPFRLPLISYSILAAFTIIGLTMVAPRRRQMFILLTPWVCTFIVEVVFFNASRYRAIGIPFMTPLAVVGTCSLTYAIIHHNWMRFLTGSLIVGLFFLAGQFSVPAQEKREYLSASYYKAAMLEAYTSQDGRLRLISDERFIRNLRTSLEYAPDNLDAFSMYTKYLILQGRCDEAAENIRQRKARCRNNDVLCFKVCEFLEKFIEQ